MGTAESLNRRRLLNENCAFLKIPEHSGRFQGCFILQDKTGGVLKNAPLSNLIRDETGEELKALRQISLLRRTLTSSSPVNPR
jgi:hypothetical protein